MDFFDRVKQLAKQTKNLSLQEFIISLNMNHDSYYSLKRAGNLPRADEALKIAQSLGVSVEYLITVEGFRHALVISKNNDSYLKK
jgi:transcriptional regulator with XRE-family HTH domain